MYGSFRVLNLEIYGSAESSLGGLTPFEAFFVLGLQYNSDDTLPLLERLLKIVHSLRNISHVKPIGSIKEVTTFDTQIGLASRIVVAAVEHLNINLIPVPLNIA